MFESVDISRMARALSAHAGARLGLIARNVAQADTPGYKAVDLKSFADTWQASGADDMRATRAGHFTSAGQLMDPVIQKGGDAMSPDGNTVSLPREMVKSVEVRQQHDMALAVYKNTSEIIRASLGRR